MPYPCPTPGCTRTKPGHLHVCRACSTTLIRDLMDVPSLARHLELAITRQTRLGAPGSGHTPDALPWDERASEARAILHNTLAGWVRALADTVGFYSGPTCRVCDHRSCERLDLAIIPDDTLPAMALWLLRHRGRLLGHVAASEAVDEICAAIRNARRSIDRAPDRIYAGPCTQCGVDLLAKLGQHDITCPGCATRHQIADRQDWMRAEAEHLLGSSVWVANVCTGLGVHVTASLIRLWVKRGKLAPRTLAPPLRTGGEPRALYRVGDVIEAATRAARKAGI